jgi:prephenate dehydratase
MLPIENSLAGSVYENYDNLTRSEDIEIVGSATLRIEHSLLAPKGASLETIESVYSHPQGLAQCDAFLAKYPRWKHIETESTSGAAEFVAASGDVTKAAIGSEANAAIYRLESLKSGIETNPRNYTRFVVIARAGEIVCASPNHASVIFSTANEPGALYAALGFFMKHGLNLTKLESRPIQGEPWRYRFYANVSLPEGVSSSVVAGESIRAALAEMGKISQDNGIVQGVRVLGLYNSKEL